MSTTVLAPTPRVAVLAGTVRQPEIRLRFDRNARHPASNILMTDWVKKAPRRHWDREAGEWVITAFGVTETENFGRVVSVNPKNPERVLRKAGFEIVIDHPGLDPSMRDVLTLEELVEPICRQSKERPSMALVRPRFGGYDWVRHVLGTSAIWDKDKQWFQVPLSDLLRNGLPKPGLIVEPATIAAAQETLQRTPEFGNASHDDSTLLADAAMLAYSTGIDLTGAEQDQVDRLVEVVGDIPDWFGMTPFPYQRLGAIAACAHRNFIADPTGLGKTLQAIAVMAIKDIDRAIVVVPPVVLTNWAREIEKCNVAVMAPPKRRVSAKAAAAAAKKAAKALAAAITGTGQEPGTAPASVAGQGTAPGHEPDRGQEARLAPPSAASHEASGLAIVTPDPTSAHPGAQVPSAVNSPADRQIVIFKSGRKAPDLPERGIVLVPDSLITSRTELRMQLAEWNPDLLVYDEAHRARNWKSSRTQAMLDLCARMRPDALRLPMTATPLFSNPMELVPLLAMSGHLDYVFGGYAAFEERYTKRDHFNRPVAKKEMLPELKQILAERVWVRRRKDEVLKDLPPVSLNAKIVDVDLTGFKAAHDEVIDKICLWLDEYLWTAAEQVDIDAGRVLGTPGQGLYPDDDVVKVWSRQQIGLMSPLRRAAGVAKVPVAMEMISDWIRDEAEVGDDGRTYWDRPLLLWAHHEEVITALVEHAAKALKDSEKKLVGVISGSTSQNQLNRYVDEFQAGRLPILVLSITAAGVGITLTKGSDQIFIESTYDVPEISQAIDRQNRIGQTRPVMVTTLLAEDTLDYRMQQILNDKSDLIEAVTGGGGTEIGVVGEEDLQRTVKASAIVVALVNLAIEKHQVVTRNGAVRYPAPDQAAA